MLPNNGQVSEYATEGREYHQLGFLVWSRWCGLCFLNNESQLTTRTAQRLTCQTLSSLGASKSTTNIKRTKANTATRTCHNEPIMVISSRFFSIKLLILIYSQLGWLTTWSRLHKHSVLLEVPLQQLSHEAFLCAATTPDNFTGTVLITVLYQLI